MKVKNIYRNFYRMKFFEDALQKKCLHFVLKNLPKLRHANLLKCDSIADIFLHILRSFSKYQNIFARKHLELSNSGNVVPRICQFRQWETWWSSITSGWRGCLMGQGSPKRGFCSYNCYLPGQFSNCILNPVFNPCYGLRTASSWWDLFFLYFSMNYCFYRNNPNWVNAQTKTP